MDQTRAAVVEYLKLECNESWIIVRWAVGGM